MKTETTEKQLGTATYSPEDNKLRFTPFARLAKDDYERARNAGFIWAPKQEIFVAPMWTPEREDLMLEWCGDIDDEDTSLVERAEMRAERFEEYSGKRLTEAEMVRESVEAIAGNIPLGQPILIGHHSERRARKDAERVENGMRKAVRLWETSKYWEDRAKGALRHAKYKERPDVRARRIKKIEADKRKQERNRAEAERGLKFWNGGFKLRHKETGETRPLEIIEENRARICHFIGNDADLGYLPVGKHPSLPQYWHAWDVLRPDGERYRECPSMTIAEVQQAALSHYPQLISRYDRWIGHYNNRLAYERAMLAEDGGIAADKNTPEKGGACRCWVRHGIWLEIIKVNKVSVTVMDNWGNGGDDFPRTVPFDKLIEIMPKAAWEARKDGGKSENQIVREFYEQFDKEHAAELDAMSFGGKFADLGRFDRDSIRSALRVKLGVPLPVGGVPAPQPVAKPAPYKKPERTAFDDMKDSLRGETGVQVVSAPQLFPTPPELAAKMVELAEIDSGVCVLEPSAGTGNIVKAIRDAVDTEVVGVEISRELCSALGRRFQSYELAVRCADFLQCNGSLGKFDRILMNPPFANGQDIVHIRHALNFLNPGGRLVAICANGPRQREQLMPLADEWIDLPAGSFKESGTMVNTAMLVINR